MVQVIRLDKSAVIRGLQLLECSGQITIEADAGGARRHTVSMTASGKQLHVRLLVTALERERLLLSRFSNEEVEILITLLRKMVDQLKAVKPKG